MFNEERDQYVQEQSVEDWVIDKCQNWRDHFETNYAQKFDDITFGWQAGIGLDLLNIMLDIRYEGNFYTFGDHIVFGDQSYAFDNSPARLLGSLAITIK